MKKNHPSRIHFGSCSSQHLKQPLWPAIIERKAQAFIWAGDAVYGDGHDGRHVAPATPEKLAADYNWMLQSNEGYNHLMESNVTIVGAWDDHDYGVNNGDRTYPHKRESATLFVDFIERSNLQGNKWPLMRQRAESGDGVYGVVVFDFDRENVLLSDVEAGIDPDVEPNTTPLSTKSVAVFLIDVRSQKSPWSRDGIKTDYQGDFLGEKQWKWLEAALQRSTASVNILVSGLQVHPDRFISGKVAEEWSRFPMAQHRLYQALLQSNVQSPLIVSGDVHMGEFLRRDCKIVGEYSTVAPMRTLIEMTTSGMTHSWGTYFCSRPEQWNPVCRYRYLQRVLGFAMHWAHQNRAWKELIVGEKSYSPEYTLELNFGEFEFDWEERTVTTRLIGIGGVPLRELTWKMDALSGRANVGFNRLRAENFAEAANTMASFTETPTSNDYFCLPYRGPQTDLYKYFGFLSSFTLIASGVFLPVLLPLAVVICIFRRSCRRKTKCD